MSQLSVQGEAMLLGRFLGELSRLSRLSRGERRRRRSAVPVPFIAVHRRVRIDERTTNLRSERSIGDRRRIRVERNFSSVLRAEMVSSTDRTNAMKQFFSPHLCPTKSLVSQPMFAVVTLTDGERCVHSAPIRRDIATGQSTEMNVHSNDWRRNCFPLDDFRFSIFGRRLSVERGHIVSLVLHLLLDLRPGQRISSKAKENDERCNDSVSRCSTRQIAHRMRSIRRMNADRKSDARIDIVSIDHIFSSIGIVENHRIKCVS